MTPRSISAGVDIGEIFLDKFRVDAILGHGGMGVVALCTHLALNERVAIKMLRRDVLDDADAVERFMREAQAASKLKSEYVARVTDVGRSATNVPYMVMEYLEGHDLDELLEERQRLGLPWAVELTLQACEALAEAHSIGIVHRDVKPSNLFVTWRPDGSTLVKVLDFGISKALTGNAMRLTQTQSLLGTPAYMSPEQMRSARHVDARTDIWSLGTVLFEMLEGRRPFEAESFSEMCVKVAVDPPGVMTNTPLQLQQVVLRCLAKQPEQRYSSMAELGRDLVPFAQDPHQAQVLAERMARTLRRSQVLDGDLAHGGVASPSGQRAAELSGPLVSNPAPVLPPLQPPASASATSDLATAVLQASQPLAVGPKSGRLAIPRRKRWTTVVAAAAVAGAATLGVALSLLQGSSTAPSSQTTPRRAPGASPGVLPASNSPAALGSAPPGGAANGELVDRASPGPSLGLNPGTDRGAPAPAQEPGSAEIASQTDPSPVKSPTRPGGSTGRASQASRGSHKATSHPNAAAKQRGQLPARARKVEPPHRLCHDPGDPFANPRPCRAPEATPKNR